MLASLGTVFSKTPGVLETIIAALATEPINLVVSIGPRETKGRFGAMPGNVRLEHSVPQATLLPHCAAFVTHCGFNSVKESLIGGVPMVGIPITADQPYCAERSAALGVARVIPPDNRTPELVQDATRAVLGDPRFRANALSFRDQMRALPGPERLVELIERLARNGSPMATSGAGVS